MLSKSPSSSIGRAKCFISNVYSGAKRFASKIDEHVRGAINVAEMVRKPVEQIMGVLAPKLPGSNALGAVNHLYSGVRSGAKEYERMRSQISTIGSAAEKIGSSV